MTGRQHGLTLIELMVALAIFAILGTLTYRGTTQLAGSGQALTVELERWRAIERALDIIETDLMEIVAPDGTPTGTRRPAIELASGSTGSELRVLGFSSGGAARRSGFLHTGERLEWRRWPDRHSRATPQTDTLLDKVRDVRWRFLGASGWVEQWPAGPATSDAVPAGIEIRLDLADTGPLTRVYALR